MQQGEDYAKAEAYQQAFDIFIMLLLETVRLVSHADDSSGAAGEIIFGCLSEINKLCKTVSEIDGRYYFEALIKTAKNKAFDGWDDWVYHLLQSAVYFIKNEEQSHKIYDIISTHGERYESNKDPDKMLIILSITERLNGIETANKYLLDNLDVPEFRKIAVRKAIENKQYAFAIGLCTDALEMDVRTIYHKPSEWYYFLEEIYQITGEEDALLSIVRAILIKGDIKYFGKLKKMYLQKGLWEEQRNLLWQELSEKIGVQYYCVLLSEENELDLLIKEVQKRNYYISDYGKQLAGKYKDEVCKIYEEHILSEARQATDRGKYKKVCHIIKNFIETCEKIKALELIEQLIEMYSRRPAMLEELVSLKKKIYK